MTTKPKVFVSYAREWRDTAERIHAALLAAGCDPWIDKRQLNPGDKWHDEIVEAIRGCDVFVACLSRQFGQPDRYSNQEMATVLACGRKVPVIPVKLEPEAYVPEELQSLHWDDFFLPGGMQRLVKEIAVHTGAGLQIPITTLAWKSAGLSEQNFSERLLAHMHRLAEQCLLRLGELRSDGLEHLPYGRINAEIRTCLGELTSASGATTEAGDLDVEVTCLDHHGRYVLHPWPGIVGKTFASQWADRAFVEWVLNALRQHQTGYLIWTDRYHSDFATEAALSGDQWDYQRKTVGLFSCVHVSALVTWRLVIEGHETLHQRLRRLPVK